MGLQPAVGALHAGEKPRGLGRFLRRQGVVHHEKGHRRRGGAGLRRRLAGEFRIAAVGASQGLDGANRIRRPPAVFAEHLETQGAEKRMVGAGPARRRRKRAKPPLGRRCLSELLLHDRQFGANGGSEEFRASPVARRSSRRRTLSRLKHSTMLRRRAASDGRGNRPHGRRPHGPGRARPACAGRSRCSTDRNRLAGRESRRRAAGNRPQSNLGSTKAVAQAAHAGASISSSMSRYGDGLIGAEPRLGRFPQNHPHQETHQFLEIGGRKFGGRVEARSRNFRNNCSALANAPERQ